MFNSVRFPPPEAAYWLPVKLFMHLFAAPAANTDCRHCNDLLGSCTNSRSIQAGLSRLVKPSQRRRPYHRWSAAPGSPPERKEKKKQDTRGRQKSQCRCKGLRSGRNSYLVVIFAGNVALEASLPVQHEEKPLLSPRGPAGQHRRVL